MEIPEIKVEDDIHTLLEPPTLKMELLEMKEEHNETFPVEHEIWDGSKVKQEPKNEITIEENTVELPIETADCALTDMLNAPFVVIQKEAEGGASAVLHKTSPPESGMQLSCNVKPSSLPVCKILSEHQYSRGSVKKIIYKKRKILTVQSTGIQMSIHETNNRNNSFSQSELLNSGEKSLKCDTINPYTCESCQKSFKQLSHLKTHKRIHIGRKRYTCETCFKCFSYLCHLNSHKTLHTRIKPYTCDTCHKCFSHISNLNSHRMIHKGIKPYHCDSCRKSFRRQSNLKTHNKIHTGSKPYTCDTCHKSFGHVSTLKTHTRIHTGIKPYTCDTCHKCFNQLGSLKRHQIIHTGSKPYTCDTCHKCFNQLSTLKTHIRQHTERKPYTCDTRLKCFSGQSELNKQVKIYTGSKP